MWQALSMRATRYFVASDSSHFQGSAEHWKIQLPFQRLIAYYSYANVARLTEYLHMYACVRYARLQSEPRNILQFHQIFFDVIDLLADVNIWSKRQKGTKRNLHLPARRWAAVIKSYVDSRRRPSASRGHDPSQATQMKYIRIHISIEIYACILSDLHFVSAFSAFNRRHSANICPFGSVAVFNKCFSATIYFCVHKEWFNRFYCICIHSLLIWIFPRNCISIGIFYIYLLRLYHWALQSFFWLEIAIIRWCS